MNDFPNEEAAMPYNPEDSAAGDSESSPILSAKKSCERDLMAIEGVEGVGIGKNQIGDDAILVYLRDETVKQRIPQNIEGFEVTTQVTGIIDAL